MAISTYPVRVEASLDPQISRWLWLVKWLLAIPHFLLLAFLWLAFVVSTVIAFFAIAFSGRYPPSLFDFNVGVLRWSWRVHYYTFGALATDQYPPFTLAEVPDYPAHLEIAYPQHLSRGLVWVKWWLLAIPHYVIVGIFVGGGTWAAWRFGSTDMNWAPGGLIGVLVLIAAVVLMVTGRYPKQIFDLVLGLNRWVLRVAAYAGLMTDAYPPFRLDMGAHEPADTLILPQPPQHDATSTWTPPGASPPAQRDATSTWAPPGAPPPEAHSGWTGGRIVALVAGSMLGLISLGLIAAGGVATWADNTQRDSTGYLTSGTHSFSTGSYALTSGSIDLGSSADVFTPADFLGTVRLRVTPVNPSSAVFVGIAPRSSVQQYLAGVSHEDVTNWPNGTTSYRPGSGLIPSGTPVAEVNWSARSSGIGTQVVTWDPGPGDWTVVVMNPDASAGLGVTTDIGATLPDLGWIAAGLLAGGALLLLAAGALIIVPISRASRVARR